MTNPFFYRKLFQDAVGRSSLSTQVDKKIPFVSTTKKVNVPKMNLFL